MSGDARRERDLRKSEILVIAPGLPGSTPWKAFSLFRA
jgi:hypothetical protein